MSLTNKGNFIINGKEYKAKSIKVSYDSLASEDSGRNADGSMHISWLYRNIRKLEIELPPCNVSEVAELIKSVQGQIYEITYFDLAENAERTTKVYTSNSSADLYSGIIRDGLWTGVQFHAIETEGES